jgi:hypothetical protein
MAWCKQNGYAIFTNNESDWEAEHKRSIDSGEDHSGVLIAGNWSTEEYYWSLRQYLETSADVQPTNRLVTISKASEEFIRSRGTA